MKNIGYTFLVYGFIVIVGGGIGYFKANSVPSLVMGLSSGLAVMLCGRGVLKNCLASFYLGSALTTLLLGFFSYRFLTSFKFMPSGLMIVLSVIVLALVVSKLELPSFKLKNKF